MLRKAVDSSYCKFGKNGVVCLFSEIQSWVVTCKLKALVTCQLKIALLPPPQVNMMTLAEHIIEATPDRIKRENFVPMESPLVERTESAAMSTTMSWLASYLADVDHLPSAAQIRSVRAEKLLWDFGQAEKWVACADSLACKFCFSLALAAGAPSPATPSCTKVSLPTQLQIHGRIGVHARGEVQQNCSTIRSDL